MILLDKIKKGFSLTELLIVLVIIAVLFAALAPIMTRRKLGTAIANEAVWSFVTDAKDAFFDPNAGNAPGAAYFGFSPSSLVDQKPYAKVYLRAKANQNHIQFRYGDNFGNLSGLFSMDGFSNILASTKANVSNGIFSQRGQYNTVAGASAYSTNWNQNTKYNVAIGGSSLAAPGNAITNTVAVGANTAQYAKGSNNIGIGANTLRGKTNPIKNTIAIGGRVLSIDESSGTDNVFVGYGVATAGFNTTDAQKNTIVASGMYGTTSHSNTIIGYEVYDANFGPSHDITAIGYKSCNSINMAGSPADPDTAGPKTCIGTTSADNKGNTTGTPGSDWRGATHEWSYDPYDHVFIGGTPVGFNGRSVLEVHNMDSSQTGSPNFKPQIAPTVVLNSHLVVRGNLYFPEVATGLLRPHDSSADYIDLSGKSLQKGKDRCGRPCLGLGRKKFRSSPACSKLLGAITAIIGAIVFVAAGIPGINALVLAGWLAYGTGLILLATGDDADYNILRDPVSGSTMRFREDFTGINDSYKKSCMSSDSKGYPDQAGCPDLQLSDIRMKENISENTDALNKIMYVMPYNYTYKNDETKRQQVGVIAQDLQKYLPDSVEADKDGYLGIKWDGIFYATINSLKNLDKQITDLDSNVEKLEKESTELAKQQKSTQDKIKELNKRIVKLEDK
ncbi:MAG: tail fiber domain-containing protein [Candidatus Gastranaerophilaceae bacterium]